MKKIIPTIALVFLFCSHGFSDANEDYIRKNAVQLNANDLSSIIDSIAEFKIVTIGEMHGSQEIPQFTLDLYSQLKLLKKNIIIGIEVPEENQNLVDKFVQSKDRSLLKQSKFFIRRLQDGRSSEAMVNLLEMLPKDTIVICFDAQNANSEQERDQKMAKNIIKAYKNLQPTLFIILAGNIHSRIEIGTPFDSDFQPMGYLLHTLPKSPIKLKNIRAIKVRYASGNIWSCMGTKEVDCKIHQINSSAQTYSSAVAHNRYFLSEPLTDGYNATLFYRNLTASLPIFPIDKIQLLD